MASETGICNSALLEVGAEKQITSLTDGSPNANIANAVYTSVRDALLAEFPWNFATKWVALAQLTTAPAFEYDYAFALPSDWLRTLAVSDNDSGDNVVDYKMGMVGTSNAILTDSSAVYLKYVGRVTDPNAMSADFRELLALRLAVKFAIPIANSGSMRDRLAAQDRALSRRVKSADSMQDPPPAIPDSPWVTDR